MIIVDDVILSDDIKEECFVCDLEKCKGACCVEGDLGAPLEKEELKTIEEAYDKVKPYLSEEGLKAIQKQGLYVFDEEGDFSTPTVSGKECAYAYYEKNGTLKCSFEKAYEEGLSEFKKPISCHLYPIRADQYGKTFALNYHRWGICSPACTLGESLKIPLYKFLKEPLTRKFGESWYKKLLSQIEP
ncbi:MAG: DUF3109 family protein [Bacteroidota bacterium]